MFLTRNAVNYSVLTSELFVLFGCAGTLTEEEEYARQDAAIQIVTEYNIKAGLCRKSHGVMVTPLRTKGMPTRKVTVEQMSSARCVRRTAFQHDLR